MHQHGGDIYNNKISLDFSSNISLLGIPNGVIQAACEGVALSYSYPDTQCSKLKEALSKSIGISLQQIVCGNGATDLIFSLVLAKKPGKALLPAPVFYEYERALRILDCEIIYYPLLEEKGFLLQEDFADRITMDVDIVFLCNPNNPTGTLIEKNLMEKIIRRCDECDSLLVVDECFMEFVDDGKDYTVIEQCGKSSNLFILKAFTKLYAMPGLRLGYGFSSNLQLLERMKEVSQPWSVSIPAQMAGFAALKEEEYVKQLLKILKKERAFLINELENLNIRIYGSKANYVFFRTIKGLHERCLEKEILIRDCSNYRGLEQGYYRIVVRMHNENRRLIEVLKEIV
jgi:threonine-phosphate decarboxylase